MSNLSQFAGGAITVNGTITTQNLNPGGNATAGSAVEIYTLGRSTLSIQVIGPYTGALSVQFTVDNINWVTVSGSAIWNKASQSSSSTIASAATGVFVIDSSGTSRVRVTALAAVTGTATISMAALAVETNFTVNSGSVNVLSSTNTIGNIQLIGRTTSSTLTARIRSQNSTNATVVKASAGAVYKIHLYNAFTQRVAFKMYNKSTAPVPGTDTPIFTIPIGLEREASIDVPLGVAFSSGISYAITANNFDADTTAVTLDSVHGFISYT